MLDRRNLFVTEANNRRFPTGPVSDLFMLFSSGFNNSQHLRFLVHDFTRCKNVSIRMGTNKSRIVCRKRLSLVHRHPANSAAKKHTRSMELSRDRGPLKEVSNSKRFR